MLWIIFICIYFSISIINKCVFRIPVCKQFRCSINTSDLYKNKRVANVDVILMLYTLDMFNTNMSLVNDMWKNIDSKLGPFKVKSDNEMFPFQEHFDMNMKYDEINFKIYLWETWNFGAPHITRIGDTILIDEKEKTGFAEWYNKISNNKFKVKIVDVGGHNDGCMNLPKPGLVVAAPWMKKEFFKDSLPGWDCLIIEHPNNFEQLYPKEYYQFRDNKKQDMAWYVDGKMDYKPLTDFVDTYLKNWVGYLMSIILLWKYLKNKSQERRNTQRGGALMWD